MKQLIFAFFLLTSTTAFAQDEAYNDIVKFNMTDSVENGITFGRKATFEAMIYNQRPKTIALQFTVKFYNTAGTTEMRVAKPYTREILIRNDEYVVTATGVYVGTIATACALYGNKIPDLSTPGEGDSTYQKANGLFVLSTPCQSYYDYIVKGFDNTVKLHQTIKAIGQKAALDGKLN